jgi:hypothetical protein
MGEGGGGWGIKTLPHAVQYFLQLHNKRVAYYSANNRQTKQILKMTHLLQTICLIR